MFINHRSAIHHRLSRIVPLIVLVSALAMTTITTAYAAAPDGNIVAVGNSGSAFALARYLVDNPPATPALTSPADGSTTTDNTPDFDWDDVTNAMQYHIQVDNNADFSSPVIDETVASSNFTPTPVLADGIYSWHVRAGNADGEWSDTSERWTVTVQTSTGITITTTTDELNANGACSLREAITNANNDDQSGSTDCAAGSGADTITFSVNGTITLSSTLPSITSEVIIDSTGQTVAVSGSSAVGIARVDVNGSLTIDTITVKNGKGGSGGGIYNSGILAINNSTLSDNSAFNAGGGIFNTGTLIVTNSTFSGNSASSGGGIYNRGTLTVINSTISGNTSNSGGGIYRDAGTVYLASTILDTGASGENCYGVVTDNGYNLSDDGSCGFNGTGSQNNVALNLGLLADNGGPTQTHLPGASSTAINLIPNGTTVNNNGVIYTCDQTGEAMDTDQRGQPRPATVSGCCDAGAVEATDLPAVPTLLSPDDGSTTNDLTPTFDWSDGVDVSYYRL
ncbi:MAG: CSLREA domain-containing protein, partial [Anaerolineae bacterium]|nr:CSLREA domain-containing protein [Anaerolineae bacterium]